jgi:hypothetical protein
MRRVWLIRHLYNRSMIVRIRDENDSNGAVQLGVSGFVIERCMRREILPSKTLCSSSS